MYLERFKKQLAVLKLVTPDQFKGCTDQEVWQLEQRLGVKLPQAYREFLLLMGKGAGQFLQSSDCFYQHLPELQTAAIELLKENHFPQPLPIEYTTH